MSIVTPVPSRPEVVYHPNTKGGQWTLRGTRGHINTYLITGVLGVSSRPVVDNHVIE